MSRKKWRKFFRLEHQQVDLGDHPNHQKSHVIAIKRVGGDTAQRIAVRDGNLDGAVKEAEGIAEAMYDHEKT